MVARTWRANKFIGKKNHQMKDFLLYLVKGIVDHPDEVMVTEVSGGENQVNLEIKVFNEDIGKVIGKGGKIIKSLRHLLKIRGIKENKVVNVQLVEE